MNSNALRTGDLLLIVRLANADAIEQVYGTEARQAALHHIESSVTRFLEFFRTSSIGSNEVIMRGPAGLLTSGLLLRVIDSLCIRLSVKPLEFEDERILLAIDAGYSSCTPGSSRTSLQEHEAEARRGLGRSSMRVLTPSVVRMKDRRRYREDMRNAADLLKAIGQGYGLFTWRPVQKAKSPRTILHYEAILRLIDGDGCVLDGEESRAALRRLGLSYLHDRQMICHVLDELEADPNAHLSLQISSSSLSFDLNGAGVAWSELLLRLRQQSDLAKRLIIEIAEPTPDAILPAAKVFIAALRSTGVKIAIAGFGSDFSSIRQMLTFQPDIIKLPSSFLQNTGRTGVQNIRLRHVVALARTLADTVVVDGATSTEDRQIAHREGAEWVVGSELSGLPCGAQPKLSPAYVPYTRDSEILRFLHTGSNHYFPCDGQAAIHQNYYG